MTPDDLKARGVLELLPCPFCGDKMEDRGYGAVHIVGKPCPIGDLGIDVERWNRRALAASPEVAKLVADAEARGMERAADIIGNRVWGAEAAKTVRAEAAAISRAAEETGP